MAVVLAVVFATFVLLPGVAGAPTLYVGGSGPGTCATIGSAVAAASPGDTISVFSGSYPEKVYIGKTLSLVGQDPATTILDDGSFFISGAPWVNISGFTLKGRGIGDGIKLWFADHAIIANNRIANYEVGAWVNSTENITFTNNTMQYNARGVVIWSSSNISVGDNTITSTHGAGVYTVASQFVTLANNSLTRGGLGVDVASSLGNILVMNNTVSRNTLGIVGGDLILGNTVTNNTVGIRGGTRVSRNTVSWNADTGIENSETVEANVVEGNGQGIRYDSTYGGRIAGT